MFAHNAYVHVCINARVYTTNACIYQRLCNTVIKDTVIKSTHPSLQDALANRLHEMSPPQGFIHLKRYAVR